MKRLILILVSVIAFVALASAQTVYSTAYDTLNGNESVNFASIRSSTSDGTLFISALCTEIGGTSDGTLILQGSTSSSDWITITETAGLFNFWPNDTLTITDGAVMSVAIRESPFKYYRFQGAGTASDTTLVQPYYMKK